MTTIRRITVSQIDGNDANSTDTNEIRPFGETAFYIDTSGEGNRLTLMMFDGTRNHRKSKVLAPGMLFGSNADSGDNNGYDTIKLIPDADLFANGSNQYLVIDPTGGEPGHIHLRAGGTQDSSTADLYIGAEQTFVRVSDTNDAVTIKTTMAGNPPTEYNWIFNNAGYLTLPTGGTLGAEGMGWTGLSNGTSGTPVSVVYKTNSGNFQAGITVTGGNDTDGIGSVIIDMYNKVTETYYQWAFSAEDGILTFPDSTEQTTAWAGGRVVNVPASSIGAAGDKAGDIAFNGSYIYYCTQNFVEASYSSTISISYSGSYPSIVKGSIPQPQAGWVLIHNGNTYTLDSNATEGNPGEWTLSLSSSISVTIGDAVTIGPASATNIWKRIQWSADTW